jgi:hypothetical protein
MKKVLLFSVLGICIISSFASIVYPCEWCFVTASKENYYYIDSENLNVSGKEITFWILKQDIETGKALLQKKFIMNCEDEITAVRDVKRFNRTDTILDAILYYDDNFEWVDIPDNSKMQVFEQILCLDSKPRANIKEYLQKPFSKKQ